MKKLMMFAAAMTIVGGAYAGVCSPSVGASDCEDFPVWDFTASGKTADSLAKGYKAVRSVKFQGALMGNLEQIFTEAETAQVPYLFATTNVISTATTNYVVEALPVGAVVAFSVTNTVETSTVPAEGGYGVLTAITSYSTTFTTNAADFVVMTAPLIKVERAVQIIVETRFNTVTVVPAEWTGDCCLASFDVIWFDKSKKTMYLIEEQPIFKMTIFGKYDLSDPAGPLANMKPGSKLSVEADVLWTIGDGCWDGFYETDEEIPTPFSLQFVGFGKTKFYMSEGGVTGDDTCAPGTEDPCIPSWDWPSWSGWFTGINGNDDANSLDLICEGICESVVGGTWSAKYNTKLSDTDKLIVLEAMIKKFGKSTDYYIGFADYLVGDDI